MEGKTCETDKNNQDGASSNEVKKNASSTTTSMSEVATVANVGLMIASRLHQSASEKGTESSGRTLLEKARQGKDAAPSNVKTKRIRST